MILQKEIRKFSEKWNIPPDTVDKDYVLGHFLSAFTNKFGDKVLFKGGTCLRKCYFPDYRFSEDTDFTAINNNFILEKSELDQICHNIEADSGILMQAEEINILRYQNKKMGYQVKIRYWGANHSKNQQPLSSERWMTKIKLEISTREICILPHNYRDIIHPYSDGISGDLSIPCYSIKEIISEKLRALIQRSYIAPRDYYDIFNLTSDMDSKEWNSVKNLFLCKMDHKNISYKGPDQLVNEKNLNLVKKAWHSSITHQIDPDSIPSRDTIIEKVRDRIKENL